MSMQRILGRCSLQGDGDCECASFTLPNTSDSTFLDVVPVCVCGHTSNEHCTIGVIYEGVVSWAPVALRQMPTSPARLAFDEELQSDPPSRVEENDDQMISTQSYRAAHAESSDVSSVSKSIQAAKPTAFGGRRFETPKEEMSSKFQSRKRAEPKDTVETKAKSTKMDEESMDMYDDIETEIFILSKDYNGKMPRNEATKDHFREQGLVVATKLFNADGPKRNHADSIRDQLRQFCLSSPNDGVNAAFEEVDGRYEIHLVKEGQAKFLHNSTKYSFMSPPTLSQFMTLNKGLVNTVVLTPESSDTSASSSKKH